MPKKITGRTKQLSLKTTPEFHVKLKELAKEEKCLMIEILEQAITVWEERRSLVNSKKITKPQTRVTPNPNKKRSWEDETLKEPGSSSKKRKFDDQ